MTTRADATRRPDRKAKRAVRSGPVFRLSESPSHLLRRAEQFAAETFLQAELPDGVTLRQTVLLAAIAESEGASQSNLVGATGVDRSTLAEMMARMEQKGFIVRSAAEDDGRAKSVSLTSQGRRRLEGALPTMRLVDKALLEALPANRRASFKATLLVLAKAADEIHGETSEPPRLPRKQVTRKAKPAARKATGKKR
ncbi:MAG TPA: MarR family transcriptional regulator [Hyphomonadaceae bacterium]|nr:MarR family transcriptional regulator [Hyphomonadaceae bacterium]HPI47846.1 MarR family transcriptional regulator [Hyphomonadaceae bacterium]